MSLLAVAVLEGVAGQKEPEALEHCYWQALPAGNPQFGNNIVTYMGEELLMGMTAHRYLGE